MSAVAEAIAAAVRNNSAAGPEAEFTPDADLLALGILDSLGIVGLVVEIEDRLGRRLRPMDVVPENFRSVNAIVRLIQQGKE